MSTKSKPKIQGTPSKAVSDVLRIRPKGLIKVTAIDPTGDKDVMRGTRCFLMPKERDALAKWIAARDGRENLYFEPNPPRQRADKRSKESDIAAVEYSYVDCDPKDGESIDAAQERIRERLASGDVPEPTFVYSSGGGLVALWRHAAPTTDIDTAKAINVGLAQALGGKAEGFDYCQSTDHLYRIPHTTNLPNAKKRAKGRKRTVASGLEGDGTTRYAPDDLPHGVVTLPDADAPALGDLDPVTLDDLPTLDDHTKEIIGDGRINGLTKTGDDSDSAWRFDAICRLVKAGVSAKQVVALFSDASNGDLVAALHDKREGNVKAVQRLVAKEYAKAQAAVRENNTNAFDDYNPADDMDDGETVVKTKPKKKAKVNRYAGVSLAAILAMKPPRWTLDGIIPQGSFFEIFGREKAGKTFWALHLALCVATGLDCFGRKVAPGRVLYIIAEGNRRLFANRVLAWIKGQTDDAKRAAELRAAIDANFRIVPVPVYMSREKEAVKLLEANPDAPSVVVVDTLFRNIDGDPNASKDMNQFIKGIDFVRTRWKATMLLLHHPGHSNTERSQGSSALGAAIDGRARFFIAKGGARVWQVMFLRDGAVPDKPDAFDLVPVVVQRGGVTYDFDDPDDNSEAIELPDLISAYLVKTEDADAAGDAIGGELTSAEELLIRIVKEKPDSQKALLNDKWKRTKISDSVADCVMHGWLDKGTVTPTKKGIERAAELDPDGEEYDENDFG